MRDIILFSLFRQEYESFLVATNDQGSSMIVVEDLVKTRSLQALVDGSKVVVNEEVPKRRSTKSKLFSKLQKLASFYYI